MALKGFDPHLTDLSNRTCVSVGHAGGALDLVVYRIEAAAFGAADCVAFLGRVPHARMDAEYQVANHDLRRRLDEGARARIASFGTSEEKADQTPALYQEVLAAQEVAQ